MNIYKIYTLFLRLSILLTIRGIKREIENDCPHRHVPSLILLQTHVLDKTINKRQELFTLREHLNSPRFLGGVRVSRQTKQKHNTIFVGHHHTQTNKKNPSKT
jgi:hypothetical protein